MKIAIATDHNGVNEKKIIIEHLLNEGYEVIDESKENNPLDNYPQFAFKVAEDVANNKADLGILLCGTGIGMSIAANKVKGIRAAKCDTVEEARLAKNHNAANVITMSYKKDINEILNMIDTFIVSGTLTEERHEKRVKMIIDYENGAYNEL